MIKAVFFDIDGTLVSFNTHTIPQSTLTAIESLRKKGIKVFIATGRPKHLMEDAVGYIPFDGYITLNGSHCFTADHRDIYKKCIPQEDVNRLIAYIEKHPEHAFVFVHDDTWFITSITPSVEEVARMIEINPPAILPAECARGKEVLQIMGYFDEKYDKNIFGPVLKYCTPMRWFPLFTDIIAEGTNKSLGIDRVLNHYNIPLKDTMAFGDGGNDIPMLKHVGTGIAMGNAAPAVQEAADYVTSSVDDDGILRALQHFNIV